MAILQKEELCKKFLNDPDNHDGVVPHLKPDILEFEVKWALGNNVCECVQLLSRVQLFVTSWTVAHQSLLSMKISRQEY